MKRLDILANIDSPRLLEQLYRSNKAAFKTEFNSIYPNLSGNKLAECWNERLNFESNEISWGTRKELTFVIIAALCAGFIAQIPNIFNIDLDLFFKRNISFVVFPVLAAYFAWKKALSPRRIAFCFVGTLIAAVFINLLPENKDSNTLILSCIHLPVVMWAILAIAFIGDDIKSHAGRLDFLRYNGDLAIMSGLLVIGGVALSGITIGLFHVIGIDIEQFYSEYIAPFGLAGIPVIASYITQTNPQLVNKISPVIARIFTPLVLCMLVIYLVAIFFSGKDPYQDRDFLMVFNLLLIGVMAIILFSIAETSKGKGNSTNNLMLLALSIVTIIVNGIAFSAILFRIAEWGLSPNRLAILGANVLMLTNLVIVMFRLVKAVSKKDDIGKAENAISMFIPVYVVWAMLVTFIFPLLFQFG